MASDVQEGVLGNKFLWLLGGAGGTYCYYKGKQSAKKDFEVRENVFKALEDAFKSREGVLEAGKGALQVELNHCQARKDALRGELNQYKDQAADFTNRTLGLFRFMPHELAKEFVLQHPGADAEIGQKLSTTTSADEVCNMCVEWLLKHPEFHQHAISEILRGYEELQVEYKNLRRCFTGPYTENFRPWILKKFVPRSDIDALQNLMAVIVNNPEKLQFHIAIVIKIIDKGLHHYVDACPGSKACFKELQVLLTVWFMTLRRDAARIKELETTVKKTERLRAANIALVDERNTEIDTAKQTITALTTSRDTFRRTAGSMRRDLSRQSNTFNRAKKQLEQDVAAEKEKNATALSDLEVKEERLRESQGSLAEIQAESSRKAASITRLGEDLKVAEEKRASAERDLKEEVERSERTGKGTRAACDIKINELQRFLKTAEGERDSALRTQTAEKKVFDQTLCLKDAKITELEGKLKTANEEYTAAKRAQRDGFDLRIEEKDGTIATLRRKAEESKQRDIDSIKLARSIQLCIAVQTFLLSKSNQRVQDLEQELAAVRSRFSSVLYVQDQKSKADKQNTEKLEARLATIEQEKEDCIVAHARVSADLSNKTAELVAAEGKITALESTGLDLKTQLGESNNARDRIQSDLDTANSRLTTLQSDKDKADAEIETLKERLISADQEFTTLQSDKDKACAEVTALKAQLASAEEASSNAKKNIERLEQIETNKDLELEELRSSEEDSKAKTLRLENDHKTTTKQLKRSEEELETKSFKLAELDNAIRTHKKEKEDDETQIQDLRDADGRWSKLCADKVADLEEAEDEARQARGEVEAIQTHLDTAIQDHKQEKATLEEVNRALQDDNRLLQAECDRAKGEIWKERQSKRALQGRPQGYWGTVDPLSSRQDEIDRGSAVLSDKVFGVFEETKTILERTLQERRKSKAVVRSVDVGTQHPPAEDGTLQLSDTISQRDPATMSGSSGSTLYEGAEGPASTSSSPGKVKEKVDFYNRIQVPHQQNARDGEDAIQGPLSESPIVQQRAATEDLNVDPGTHLCRCSTFDLCVHGHRTWSKSGSKEQCTLCHRTYELRELDEVLFSVQCETCREKFETEWQWKEHSETSGHTEHTTVVHEIIPLEDETLENEEFITIDAKLVEEQFDGLKNLDEEDREAALQALASSKETTESRTNDRTGSNKHGNSHHDAEELQPQGNGSQGRDGSEIDYEHFTSALSDDELSNRFDGDGDGDDDHARDSDNDEDNTGDDDHADNAASPIVDPQPIEVTPSPSPSPPTGLARSAFASPPNVALTTPPGSPSSHALSPASTALEHSEAALCFPCGTSFEDADSIHAHIMHSKRCKAEECRILRKSKHTICYGCKKVVALGQQATAPTQRHRSAEFKARSTVGAPRRTDREQGTETTNAWHVFDQIDLSNLEEMDFNHEETSGSATATTGQCSGPARAERSEEAVLSSPTQGLPSATLGTNESFETAQSDANQGLEDGQQGSLNAMMQAFARHFGLPLEELSGIVSQIAEGLSMTLEEVETWVQNSNVTHEEVLESVLLALVQTSPVSETMQETVVASRELDTQLMALDDDAEGPANTASSAEDMGRHYIMDDQVLLDALEEQGELQVFPQTTQDDLSPALLSRRRTSTTGSLSFPLAGPRDDMRADAILCPHRDSIWGCNRASCERIHQCARCETIGLCIDHDDIDDLELWELLYT